MPPVVLGPNQRERFYRGGERIAAFRGLPVPGERYPEDWVGSTTPLFDQDGDAMLAAMHALPVAPGDGVLVPAGLPHAIGEGVLLVELQEPTDFSVLMQWEGFELDGPAEGHLGLGFDLALRCVDRRGWALDALQELRGRDLGSAGVS